MWAVFGPPSLLPFDREIFDLVLTMQLRYQSFDSAFRRMAVFASSSPLGLNCFCDRVAFDRVLTTYVDSV